MTGPAFNEAQARRVTGNRGTEWRLLIEQAAQAAYEASRVLKVAYLGDDPGPWLQRAEEKRQHFRDRATAIALGYVRTPEECFARAVARGADDPIVAWATAKPWRRSCALLELTTVWAIVGPHLPEVHGDVLSSLRPRREDPAAHGATR